MPEVTALDSDVASGRMLDPESDDANAERPAAPD